MSEIALSDVANLREVVTKTDIKNMATKSDVTEAEHSMILWVVGVGIVILLAILLK